MTLTSSVGVSVAGTLTSALDLATASVPLQLSRALALANGVGANQADRIFHDRRTLAASATEDLDLAGVLLDPFGAAITFAKIRALLIAADAANTNNVLVGGASANGFVSWVGGATHTVTVRPGGLLLLTAPDATAYAVTAATADLLKIANSAGGTGVTYDIVIIGASA
jgi:hypothetical protein